MLTQVTILEIAQRISLLPKHEVQNQIMDILWSANLSKEDAQSILESIREKSKFTHEK